MDNPQPKNFEQLSEAVRYYKWFSDTIAPWIGNRVLDVGCGHGNVIVNFMDRDLVHGIDIEERYLTYIKNRFSKNSNFSCSVGDISKPETPATLRQYRFDSALCFNVLEHIRDDRTAAINIRESITGGGHAVFLVPAFEALTSHYDRMVGHFRRYTLSSLSDIVSKAGFSVVHKRYFNMAGFVAWFLNYKLLKKDAPGKTNLDALERMVPMLKFIEDHIRAPFGISAIAVGRKQL